MIILTDSVMDLRAIHKKAGYVVRKGKEIDRMSLDKSIAHGKEHRKPYHGAKAIDHTCRNHGSCEWCMGNRTYKNEKRELQQKQSLDE